MTHLNVFQLVNNETQSKEELLAQVHSQLMWRKGHCDSGLVMWKLVQWHEYMTQEGINSHLRAHSILSPFVTCTIYKVSCRILCSWVFESPQHAAVITQRHRLVVASESKKAPVSLSQKRSTTELLSAEDIFFLWKLQLHFIMPSVSISFLLMFV